MKVERFITGILGTNSYLAINEETKQAVVFDPAALPHNLKEYIKREGLKIEAILLTHGHFDHIMGLDAFVEEFNVPVVYIHEKDEDLMTDPNLNLSSHYILGYTYSKYTCIRDGQILKHAGAEFKVIHTPGHTRGGCCYYLENEGVLFSGDTLFHNSIGRTDFPTSSMSDMVRSVRGKLFVLPDDTKVYPGHMDETTIGHEKRYNPYV